MPLHTRPVHDPRRLRIAGAAAIAAACIGTGAATIVITDDQPVPPARSITAPNPPATSRYYDIEAYKAITVRALGRRIAQQQTNRTPRHPTLEPKMARLQRGR